MMLNKKVSIIIPLYNTNKFYLKKCIESCINQTYKNVEIIVVDDGSTIDYTHIFKKYTMVRMYKLNHSGVSNARNYGIKKSSGYWIFFLDSDDYLNNDSIEKIVNVSNSQCDVVISSTKIDNEEKKIINNSIVILDDKIDLYKSIFISNHLYKCVDTSWGKLIKKSLITKNNIEFDPNLIESEDGLFNFKIYYYANRIILSNEVIYNYRKNGQSLCNQYKENQDKNCEYLLKQYTTLIQQFHLVELEDDLCVFSIRLFCRLLRKYYFKERTYRLFFNKITKLDELFKQLIVSNKYKQLSFGRKLILYLYKNNHLYLLYKLNSLKLNIK